MAGCSKSGKDYELQIYNVVKCCTYDGRRFNTQNETELGGSSSKNDIECNVNAERDLSIEAKRQNTPDWMQCSLKYDNANNKWIGSSRQKIPEDSKKLFEELVSSLSLFNGKIPPFMNQNITHEEWIKIKQATTDFKDAYFPCSSDTIRRLYSLKGCSYIQISGKGLYHLGNDICGFNVPLFDCEQQLRVRTKIHTRKDSKGFCNLSVTIACQPKNIKALVISNFSLDDRSKLPHNLVYNDDSATTTDVT